ncbi:DUF4349 domain-containing protein [Agromyces sp. G08B096]|uniref:DUF4349 domain-containing protein n=1 Tax=Agromyces sp. G08B096 TaxID=3156399 RepID=A0AAU7W9Q3_9MICO
MRSATTPRIRSAAIVAGLAALLLAGCTAGGQDASTVSVEPAPAQPDLPVEMLPEDSAGGTADGARELTAEASDADRSVITTAWVSITVDDPIATADDAADLATEAGGRIDSRTETPGTDVQPANAQLVLRVPAEDLDGVVDALRELGTVTQVSMNASDVTQQRQDLDARIEALTTSVDRLTELLAQATTTTDLIAIESELTTRQAELDSLTQQRALLVDQVEYSTLSVDLVTEQAAPDPKPDTFWDGVVAGWEALTGFFAGLAVVLGVLLPWLLAAAVIAAVVLVVVLLATRGARRQRREGATPNASGASGGDEARPAPHREDAGA